MSDFERLMSTNVKGGKSPTGMHAGGRGSGLGQAGDRMSYVIHRANDQGISLIGGQEVSGVQIRRVLQQHGNYLPVVATPNEQFKSGATIGNAGFIDTRVWDLEEQLDLVSALSDRTLHFVDMIVRHRATGRHVRVIVGHWPAGRRLSARRGRAHCEADVRAAIKGETLPVVLLFDFNTPTAFRGWAGARHHVDAALVRGLPTSKPRVHDGFNRPGPRKISDHAAVSVRVDLRRPA